MRRALLLALALSACDAPADRPVDDLRFPSARVLLIGPHARDESSRELVADAGEILGIKLEAEAPGPDAPARGAITVAIYPGSEDVEGGLRGEAHVVGGPESYCHRVVWCYDEATLCAHEIGHALGLQESTSGGLMDSPAVARGGALTLSTSERAHMIDRADRLSSKCQ